MQKKRQGIQDDLHRDNFDQRKTDTGSTFRMRKMAKQGAAQRKEQ